MLTVKVEELLKAVEQLNQPDLERFVSQVIALQAQRQASSLTQTEAELLLKINQAIPSDTQKHYNKLLGKREAENITTNEYRELLQLTEQIEKLQVQRIEYLAELARLRGITLIALMESLGIQTQMNDNFINSRRLMLLACTSVSKAFSWGFSL